MRQPRSKKLAFIVKENRIIEKEYEFDFFGGFAITQKQKTIESFHLSISLKDTYNILEVSRKSKNQLGNQLSAFNLLITINNNKYPLECVYQSSKIFNRTIQFYECLTLTPLESKKLVQTKVKEFGLVLSGFNFFGIEFPISPSTLFYDYIYVLALSQNLDIANQITDYNCFTDIEFNHKKQFASQARSCAIYKYLYDTNQLSDAIQDISVFRGIYENVIVQANSPLSLFD